MKLEDTLYGKVLIHGPYYRMVKPKDSRPYKQCVVHLISNGKCIKTVSYGKFVLEHHIGRRLLPNEAVSYKDGDVYNTSIDNLSVEEKPKFVDTVYGPRKVFIQNQVCRDGYKKVRLVARDGTVTMVQYHRFVMQEHLGEILPKNKIVHHIDGDVSNNNVENLQVMGWREHNSKHRPHTKPQEFVCQVCGNKFIRSGKALRNIKYNHEKYGYKGPFCSASCRSTATNLGMENFSQIPVVIENDLPELKTCGY